MTAVDREDIWLFFWVLVVSVIAWGPRLWRRR